MAANAQLNFDPVFDEAGRAWNVDPNLLRAVASQESGGNARAQSRAGAQGLMQLLPSTAKGLGVTDTSDPVQSIWGGAKYLSQGLDAEGTPEGALLYYHGGPGWRDAYGPESAGYVPGVSAKYQQIVARQGSGGGQARPAAGPKPAPAAAPAPAQAARSDAAASDPSMDFDGFLKRTGAAPAPAAPSKADGAGASVALASDPNMDFDGFLKRTGAAPAPAPTAAATPANATPPANVDPLMAAGRVASATATGATEAFGSDPLGMSPETVNKLRQIGIFGPEGGGAGLVQNLNEGAARVVAPWIDLGVRGLAAITRGAQAGIVQGGEEVGQPQLGRDLASIPDAFAGSPGHFAGNGPVLPPNRLQAALAPAPDAAGANRLAVAVGAPETAGVSRLTSATAADGPPPLNMLPISPEAAAAAQTRAVTAEPLGSRGSEPLPPATGMGARMPAMTPAQASADAAANGWRPMQPNEPLAAGQEVATGADGRQYVRAVPAPSAAGAAATAAAEITAPTKAQALTNLQKSVTQSATDRAGTAMEDHTVYVDGVQRPLAARVFTPQNALDDKLFRATDPAYRAAAEKLERANNEIMVDKLAGDAGDANALQAAHDARQAVAPPAQQLFEGEKPVDAQPWVDAIDKLLAGPEGKRSSVERTLNDIRAKLYDGDGNLETLPSQLYGARQNMTDILKKGAGVGDMAADAKLSKSVVAGLLDVADPIINKGAPKYQDYLDQFHEASQPINQMEWLQKYQTGSKKITDLQGNLMFGRVQKMLDDALQERSKSGVNKGSSLSDDQLDNIIAVRNELAANQLRDRTAAVKGSDTTQQTNRAGVLGEGPLGVAVKGAAGFLAHGAIMSNPATAGWGNAALGTYQSVISPAMKAARIKKAAEALEARKSALLSTDRVADEGGNLLPQRTAP